MKDRLLEMLMHLFETSIESLKQDKLIEEIRADLEEHSAPPNAADLMIFSSPKQTSTRVLTSEEQIRLTKASYQYLVRLQRIGVIAPEVLEIILHRLMLSDSQLVTLSETKWTIRSIIGEGLEPHQLAFLDLVLYQKEDNQATH